MTRRSQPTYLTVGPNGEIGAEFTGHVTANEGLDLLAGLASTPPDNRRIRWLRESDGVLVADVQAWHAAGESTMVLESSDDDAKSQIVLDTTPPERITLNVTDGFGVLSRRLIALDGSSDFVQARDLDTIEIDWTGATLDFYVNGVLRKSI